MTKKLMVNMNPFIRLLPQYAFIDAIINNVDTNQETVCELEIKNIDPKDWDFMIKNGSIKIKDNIFNVSRKAYGTRPLGGWYRYIERQNEIVFNVKYMQYVNRWDSIIMFLDAHQNFTLDEKSNLNFKLSIYCCGNLRIDVNDKMTYYRENKENKDIEGWYKVKLCNADIEIYESNDSVKWELLHICENVWHTNEEKLIGGFYIHLYDNQYYKWICNNFIQMRYRKGDIDKIGYPGLMNRDWRNYAIHPLVRFGYEKREIVLKYGLWDYIRNNIDSNRYLEVYLNEFYIEGLTAYEKKTFFHESLIYGYNEEKKSVQMLSIYKGKFKALEVPIYIIENAWSEPVSFCTTIRSLEYSPDENGYELDIVHICKELQNYLYGKNSTEDYMYIAQKEEGAFGLKVYDDILKTDIGQCEFLSDVRISYMIKEHKECMKFRIDYLYEKELLSLNEYLKINNIMNDILKLSEVVLDLVMKNMILEKKQVQNRIWDYLEKIKEQEQECYGSLLNILKHYEEEGKA